MEWATQAPIAHRPAEAEMGAEVRTERTEDVRHSRVGAEEHQLLAEIAHRHDLSRRQVRRVGDLKPPRG
jgi:hypothetical protein